VFHCLLYVLMQLQQGSTFLNKYVYNNLVLDLLKELICGPYYVVNTTVCLHIYEIIIVNFVN
jgi:hypothetical protein